MQSINLFIQIFKSLFHTDQETFLRSLSRQIEPVKKLATTLGYDSINYQSMLNLHMEQTFEDKIKLDLVTDYERVSISYLKLFLIRCSGTCWRG